MNLSPLLTFITGHENAGAGKLKSLYDVLGNSPRALQSLFSECSC